MKKIFNFKIEQKHDVVIPKTAESSTVVSSNVENAIYSVSMTAAKVSPEKNVEKIVQVKQQPQRVSTVVNNVTALATSNPPSSTTTTVPVVVKQQLSEDTTPQSATKRKCMKYNKSNRNVKNKIDIQIKCASCVQIFTERRLAEAHFRQKHLGLKVIIYQYQYLISFFMFLIFIFQPYICSYCTDDFEQWDMLCMHVREQHNIYIK